MNSSQSGNSGKPGCPTYNTSTYVIWSIRKDGNKIANGQELTLMKIKNLKKILLEWSSYPEKHQCLDVSWTVKLESRKFHELWIDHERRIKQGEVGKALERRGNGFDLRVTK